MGSLIETGKQKKDISVSKWWNPNKLQSLVNSVIPKL